MSKITISSIITAVNDNHKVVMDTINHNHNEVMTEIGKLRNEVSKAVNSNPQPKAEKPSTSKKGNATASTKPQPKAENLTAKLLKEFRPSFTDKDGNCKSWGPYKKARVGFLFAYSNEHKLGSHKDARKVFFDAYKYIKKDGTIGGAPSED